MNIRKASACVALLLLLSACGEKEKPADESATPSETVGPNVTVKPYDDLRDTMQEEGEFDPDHIFTFTFNEGTVLKGSEDIQAQVMEAGKNPGLGIRAIHAQGITGKNVNVAIIDQNLLLDHPEFSGKIAAYYDTGCEQPENEGSMHAPAVTSILVGEHTGVAPDARVYFAAAPSWKGDSEYYAKGLFWIIEENRKLPGDEKIRVVSVSAAPSGDSSPFTEHLDLWDNAVAAARDEGILVLDCRVGTETGIIAPAHFDPDDREDASLCRGGFPLSPAKLPATEIGVPTSYRTCAEEYEAGVPSYQYYGQGGLSWGIPYAAGVLALGWQANPELDNEEIVQLLFDTCATGKDGSPIIDPAAIIQAVQETSGGAVPLDG